MHYYSYEALEADMLSMLPACRAYNPDAIVALARGGMIGAQLLGYALGIRRIGVLRVESYDGNEQRSRVEIEGDADAQNSERILIVDDIVDTGHTLQAVKTYLNERHPEAEIKCAAPWYKKSALAQPDIFCNEATEWVEFFWDRFGK